MLIRADARKIPLKDKTVQMVCTSPPYWGLRSYGTMPLIWDSEPNCTHEWGEFMRTPWANSASGPNGRMKNLEAAKKEKFTGPFCRLCGAWRGELGLEPDYQMYIAHILEIFKEIWRILRDDGTLWLNLVDSYATGAGKVGDCPGGGEQGNKWKGYRGTRRDGKHAYLSDAMGPLEQPNRLPLPGLKPKDLCMIPARVALALQADGWYLRSDIIWSKSNPMPESVTDRPTKAHEYIFLLSKSERYYYDADAIRESFQTDPKENYPTRSKAVRNSGQGFAQARGNDRGNSGGFPSDAAGRNCRSVWNITTHPYSGAHFATFPREIPERCIKAGSKPGDIILDPFVGSGTVCMVAADLGRTGIGLDLKYQDLASERIGGSLFKSVVNSAWE